VWARLQRYFDGIDAAKHIDKLTLHYLDGKIRVELLLPLEVLPDASGARELRKRFNLAVKQDPQIASVELRFH
jgi:hypothetical protein